MANGIGRTRRSRKANGREHIFKGIPGDWQVFKAEMNR
jgi:hypothetical protein